jgi:hypothetical protein
LTEFVGRIEGIGVNLRVTCREAAKPQALFLSVASGGEGFQHVMQRTAALSGYPEVAMALFEPRLSGWNYAGVGCPTYPAAIQFEFETRQAKAMSLLGATPVSLLLQDIQIACAHLREQFPEWPLYLHGRGESAVASLLAALLDPGIAGAVLEELPWSFADRSAFIGVLRVLDIPHAVGLLAPRPVALINRGDGNWSWPARAYGRLGCEGALTSQPDFGSAAAALFPPVRAA